MSLILFLQLFLPLLYIGYYFRSIFF